MAAQELSQKVTSGTVQYGSLILTGKLWILLTDYEQQGEDKVRLFTPETANKKQTEMYIKGFKVKLKKNKI